MEEALARRPRTPDAENSALVFLEAFAAMEAVAFGLPRGTHFEHGFSGEIGMRNADAVLQLVRASVEADAEALRLIHEGAALPAGAYPVVAVPNALDVDLSHLHELRNAARLCLRETAVRAHDGDGAAAADSLIAMRRLAASVGDRTFLIGVLVRIAVDAFIWEGLGETLGLCEIPPEKLAALARELALEAEELSLLEAMRMERATACQLLTSDDMEAQLASDEVEVQRTLMELQMEDRRAAAIARAAVDYLDVMQEVIRIASLADGDKLSESDRLGEQLERRQPGVSPIADLLLPSVDRLFEEEVKARTRVTVTRVALAVEQYRIENGGWPESLDALVPEFIDAVPQDPYGEGRIRYRREATGVVVRATGEGGAVRLLEPARRGARKWAPEIGPEAHGLTALHVATQAGDRQRVERLLADEPDVDKRDADGRTALHFAAVAGRREIAELLLEHGADVNATDLQGRTPTGLAAQARHAELADLLRRHGGVE
jgi:hypothetical protein